MTGPATRHPRTAVTLSRVLQGVSSFAFAAAAAGGIVAASTTLAVAGLIGLVGAAATGSSGALPALLRDRTVWAVAATGVVSLVLAAQAYQEAGVATVSFLLLLVPVYAGLMSPLFGERLTRANLLGLGISLVGIACFARPTAAFASEWLGILLALAAGAALGLIWYQSRALAARRCDPWATTAATMLVPGTAGLLFVGLLERLPTGGALAWLLVAGLGYAGNSVLRLTALRAIKASSAALIAPVSALTSTALAFALLGQVPDLLTCVGAVVVVIGVVVSQRPRRGVRRGRSGDGLGGGQRTV